MSGVLHGVIASLKTAVAAVTDAYFKYVTLLLNTTSTNGAQNNTFLDSSTNAFSITRNGNTTQGTFSPFSQTGWSNYFDGAGDYLTAPDNAAFDFGSGDFTVEAFVYLSSLPASNARYNIFGQWGPSPAANDLSYIGQLFNDAGTMKITFDWSTTGTTTTAVSVTAPVVATAWLHIAWVRSGTSLKIFLNGTEVTSGNTITGTLWNSSRPLNIGRNEAGNSNLLNGYLSNLRIVKGTAVYTSNFTPPTTPLTAISGTSLLTCQSNRFIDNSSNAFAITRNGDVSVQAFSPFNPTAAWDAGTNGGSGYFDGTGDFLTAPSNAAFAYGTGDFTWEAWIYPTSNTGYVLDHGSNGGTISYDLGRLRYYNATTGIGGTLWTVGFANNPALNTWHHIAAVRSGGTTFLYFNGVLSTSATDGHNYGNQGVSVGQFGGGGLNYPGYVSNLRLVKGTAVYTSAFTPPTAPLTAIANTSLLLNFTNAGIYDSASGNDLETVGNAQVSTTVAKFGTTSMAFDGTGDWLTVIDKPTLRFGTGAFTVEGWLYLSATGAARGVVGKGTSTTGWLLSTDASDKVVFTYGTSTIVSTGALSGSTWYHIAVVREGTGANQTKIYIDGVNDGTGTVSTDFNQTSIMYVGANRTAGDALNGYIDDLRITNGYARYTGNFTPPTAAFPLN